MKFILEFILSLAFLALVPSVGTMAQITNDYGIPDELYGYMKRASRDYSAPNSLVLMDSMYNRAVEMKEPKAMILARSIGIHYYYRHSDKESLSRICQEVRDLSVKYDYMQYYYYAYQQEVNLSIILGEYDEALYLATTLLEESERKSNPRGLYLSYDILGKVHIANMSYEHALECLHRALEEAHKAGYTTTSSILSNMARVYFHIGDLKRSKQYFMEAMSSANSTATSHRESLGWLSRISVLEDDVEAHRNYIKEYDRLARGTSRSHENSSMRYAVLYFDKKYDELESLIDTTSAIDLSFYRRYYENRGRYDKALWIQRIRRRIRDRHIDASYGQLARFSSRLEANREKRLNDSLLNLKDEMELSRIRMENSRIANLMLNDSLEAVRISDLLALEALEHQRVRQAREDSLGVVSIMEENRRQVDADRYCTIRTVMLTAIILLSILTALGGYFIIMSLRRKRTMDRALARAREADRMKELFVQNVSHEIRTPLNAIVSFTSLLSEAGDEISAGEKEDYAQTIESNTSLLTTLVDDLILFSAMESGNISLNEDLVGPNDLASNAIRTVAPRCPEGVRMYMTSSLAQDMLIRSDAKRLSQVLINFLTNACKHTHEGEIEVQISEDDENITFAVRDTGEGIAKDLSGRLFDRFETLGTEAEGTGLGLSICKSIARTMKAHIALDEEYKNGARFIFQLRKENVKAG